MGGVNKWLTVEKEKDSDISMRAITWIAAILMHIVVLIFRIFEVAKLCHQ